MNLCLVPTLLLLGLIRWTSAIDSELQLLSTRTAVYIVLFNCVNVEGPSPVFHVYGNGQSLSTCLPVNLIVL